MAETCNGTLVSLFSGILPNANEKRSHSKEYYQMKTISKYYILWKMALCKQCNSARKLLVKSKCFRIWSKYLAKLIENRQLERLAAQILKRWNNTCALSRKQSIKAAIVYGIQSKTMAFNFWKRSNQEKKIVLKKFKMALLSRYLRIWVSYHNYMRENMGAQFRKMKSKKYLATWKIKFDSITANASASFIVYILNIKRRFLKMILDAYKSRLQMKKILRLKVLADGFAERKLKKLKNVLNKWRVKYKNKTERVMVRHFSYLEFKNGIYKQSLYFSSKI